MCPMKSQGQTILEVVVALSLIILFLSGIVIVELFAIKNMEYAQNVSLATKLARQQLERAKIVRDAEGMDALSIRCTSPCYINGDLTPVPITPTGTYGQKLQLVTSSASDCPLPDVTITPAPISYKATAIVSWSQNATITPAPQVELSSCLTNWR